MESVSTLPRSLADRLALGSDEIRLEASYDEFVKWLEQVDYPIEYENGEIIIMSIASDEHERIVANLLGALFLALRNQSVYGRYGSNRHIYIPHLTKAYSPDASVVKGEVLPFEYAKGKSAYTNPWLVAEVISPSSRNRDFGEKLQAYKAIASLQYILYLEQDRPFVTLFERLADSERWQSTDYNALDQILPLAEFKLMMSDLYDSIKFNIEKK